MQSAKSAMISPSDLERSMVNIELGDSSTRSANTIPDIEGKQYIKSDEEYNKKKYQYATSSHTAENRMDPDNIIYPKNINDIKLAVKYARKNNIAVAIRTGGHQYSGASSTSGPNIQLDLRDTFLDFEHVEKDGNHHIRTGVSWDLRNFNRSLGEKGLFVPHGQCSHVHLGGHVQTGGYGQLGRSFGLFGDHVVEIEIINHEGNKEKISKDNKKELFDAILGGSPGNLGVITHFTIKVYSDKDYMGSRGLKALFWYDPDTLKNLLNIMVKMTDDKKFPRNYDYCVSVLSKSCKLPDIVHDKDNLDKEMKSHHPEIYGEDNIPIWPQAIIVYAQYVPFNKTDICDMKWFDDIMKAGKPLIPFINSVKMKEMSKLTRDWIFMNVREFDFPYVKRTYFTNSKTLVKDGWVDWVTGRIDDILKSKNNCYLSVQIQNFGGENSEFYNNRNNGTSFSWRDSTIVCVLDCFYDQKKSKGEAKKIAEDWQETNDKEGIGLNGKFSKEDRRLLWGSYGDFDLDKTKEYYYDDETYEKLCTIKKKVDPDGVFTPNAFSVGGKIEKYNVSPPNAFSVGGKIEKHGMSLQEADSADSDVDDEKMTNIQRHRIDEREKQKFT